MDDEPGYTYAHTPARQHLVDADAMAAGYLRRHLPVGEAPNPFDDEIAALDRKSAVLLTQAEILEYDAAILAAESELLRAHAVLLDSEPPADDDAAVLAAAALYAAAHRYSEAYRWAETPPVPRPLVSWCGDRYGKLLEGLPAHSLTSDGNTAAVVAAVRLLGAFTRGNPLGAPGVLLERTRPDRVRRAVLDAYEALLHAPDGTQPEARNFASGIAATILRDAAPANDAGDGVELCAWVALSDLVRLLGESPDIVQSGVLPVAGDYVRDLFHAAQPNVGLMLWLWD